MQRYLTSVFCMHDLHELLRTIVPGTFSGLKPTAEPMLRTGNVFLVGVDVLTCTDGQFAHPTIYLIKNFRPDHTIYRRIPVPVFRFQSIVDILDFDKIGIIKIDVEGSELEVIKSLYELLESHRPIVLLEVLPIYSNENLMRKERQEELERIFSELDFSFFRVIKQGNQFTELKRIDNIGIHSDLNQCDYVVVPSESIVKIQDLV